MAENVRAQGVLEFWQEARCGDLTDCLNVGQFRFDEMEKAEDFSVGVKKDPRDVGLGANREPQYGHAIRRFRAGRVIGDAGEEVLP